MQFKLRPSLLLLAFLFAGLCAHAAPQLRDPTDLTWTPEQSKTAAEIVARLENQHYNKQAFNDELSSRLLDSYIESLDPQRLFLLQSDIDEFQRYRHTLDDTLRRGELEPGFLIFQRYATRIIDRLRTELDRLEETIAAMDFSRDEYLETDRSKAPWPRTAAEADELWRLRLKNNVLSLRLAGKPEEEIVELLQKRYRNQLNRVQQYEGEDVFQTYMNALASLYDPHTNYLSPRTSENFNINMSLKLQGIGAVLQAQDEYTQIARLVPAGPAHKQGELQPADRIVGVAEGLDGPMQDIVGWRLDDVVDLIRGEKGTIVRLEVIPAGSQSESERKVIAIERNEVNLEEQSAQKRVLEIWHNDRTVKLGVIDIPAFYIDFDAMRAGDLTYRSTTRDVQKLLQELLEEGVEGIVVDLRDNGGGSLQEANALIGLFIDSGPTVQIRHSSTRVFREGKPRSSAYYDGPLLVLINRLSASASEIFAGAIQDYQRGIVVGDQSFGKGTVQSLAPLQHGELKLTESKFYRISGDSTQHRGVVPDLLFPSIYSAAEVGESAFDNALPWDRISPVRHRIYFDIEQALPQLRTQHQRRIETDPDFVYLTQQLALAEELRNRTRVSLNEEKRREQQAEEKKRQLALENARRKSRGLEPLTDLASTPAELDADLPAGTADTENRQDEVADPLLMEAAHVLADALPIYQRPSFAYRDYRSTGS